MKLAEFKRTMKPGDFVTLISNTLRPDNPLIGVRRKVMAVNTVDLIIETEKDGLMHKSHTPLPKAADLLSDGESFSFVVRSTISDSTAMLTWKWERTQP
jgi:hypothetical protein